MRGSTCYWGILAPPCHCPMCDQEWAEGLRMGRVAALCCSLLLISPATAVDDLGELHKMWSVWVWFFCCSVWVCLLVCVLFVEGFLTFQKIKKNPQNFHIFKHTLSFSISGQYQSMSCSYLLSSRTVCKAETHLRLLHEEYITPN